MNVLKFTQALPAIESFHENLKILGAQNLLFHFLFTSKVIHYWDIRCSDSVKFKVDFLLNKKENFVEGEMQALNIIIQVS